MKSGIYSITNTQNGKTYIGSSVNIRIRWRRHKLALREGKHKNPHLQAAWNKYGEAAFVFEVWCYRRREDLLVFEQMFLDLYRPDYNICMVVGNGSRGTQFSNTRRQELSEARRGVPWSALRRAAPVTAEARANMSEAGKRRVWTEETRKRISQAITGKHPTPETRAKLSAARKGVSPGNKGKKTPAEVVAKISAARKGKPWTPARREAQERKKKGVV